MNKESQSASTLLMIRPVRFGSNAETACDNRFQHSVTLPAEEIQALALEEFNNFVKILESKEIETIVFDDTPIPLTPDSIFPNNWVSFHSDGTAILYPMEAEDRRSERRQDILEDLEKKYGFEIRRVLDFSREEQFGRYLESTGSMVFDYVNEIIYASLSRRTNKSVLEKVAKELGYKIHCFEDVDNKGSDIYHTNVVMCLGEKFCLLWENGITDPEAEKEVRKSLENTNHEIIDLTFEQIEQFAGNALEVENKKGKKFLIMSSTGVESLKSDQRKILEKYVEIVPVPVQMIQKVEGGSARCMLCDVRLPKKKSVI